jgi:FAD:protein FMN transferase
VLLLLLGLSVFTYWRDPRAVVEARSFSGETMGTTYRVVLGASGPDIPLSAVQASVDSLLRAVNASMSTYDPASELSRINAGADTGAVELSPALAGVLREALDVYRASGGRFDVTVGPLVDAWGFGAAERPSTPLTAAALDSIRAFVGSDKLVLRGDTLVRRDPRVRIDLSAIAKGYGVDAVSDLLLARGVTDHLVEIGGELRARGQNLQGEAFRVGIEEPDPERIQVRLAVALSDRALATSGNYRNYYDVDGVRYVHTLDPVSGRPVRHTLLAASVLHAECSLADAWATALMAAGPDSAWALAQANSLDVLLLVDGGEGQVTERATPGFEAAIRRLPR